jgi:hypothetical protein
MFTINSYSDVVAVADTFGVQALRYAMDNFKVSQDTTMLICQCMAWASSEHITITEVNDGNVEYCIYATFKASNVAGQYITNLNDITIIRTGVGSFTLPVIEAVNRNEITMDSLRFILSEIDKRNKAADAFNF